MAAPQEGCVKPAAGPIAPQDDGPAEPRPVTQEVSGMQARVGRPAPDFEVTAYIPEKGDFAPVKLSDYKGQWITLCFYPGDFTFV